MLILILIDVHYSQKAVSSFEKGSNCQNYSSSSSLYPVKKSHHSKIPNSLHPLLQVGKPCTYTYITYNIYNIYIYIIYIYINIYIYIFHYFHIYMKIMAKIKDIVHPLFHLLDFFVVQTVQNSQNFFIRITSME